MTTDTPSPRLRMALDRIKELEVAFMRQSITNTALRRSVQDLHAECARLRNQPTPAAWIATNQHGDVLHFSKHDGWTINVVVEERK